MLSVNGGPFAQCAKPASAPCRRRHYKSLKDIGNVSKFQAVMESISPATHKFSPSTAVFATQVYTAMGSRLVPDTTAGAAPGSLMVNTN